MEDHREVILVRGLGFHDHGYFIFFWKKKIFFFVREGVKKCSRLYRGHVPYQGWGSTPLPLKKIEKYSACPKTFLLKQLFCIVPPTLSTGSNEIFIIFFVPIDCGLRGVGCQSLGDISPENSSTFF